jgi:hypothetical protein
MPRDWESASLVLSRELSGMIYVTVHPEAVAAPVVRAVDWVAALGEEPDDTLAAFARAGGHSMPRRCGTILQPGEALLWWPGAKDGPLKLHVAPPRSERRRHRRKYAEGELAPDRSFYFRGAQGKLNLRAQNLILFLQIAEGVDDGTWLHHLRAHDYSTWMREIIKNPKLGEAVKLVEDDDSLDARSSRERIRAIVEQHYTLPPSGEGTR